MRALAGSRPLSDAWELFLTNVFNFIHRQRGLYLCSVQHLVVCSYIHWWMPLRKWEALFIRNNAWTVRTSSGRKGECAPWRCTEPQVSQNLSRPAGPHGSLARQCSIIRDTPRSTATAAGPTPRDSDRGHPNWVRSVDPRKVRDFPGSPMKHKYKIDNNGIQLN